VTMLAAVLRSRTAVRVSLGIIDAFVAMRRTLASMGQVLTRLETVERRQITDQSRNEARFDAIFAKMGEGEIPLSQIFCHDRFVIIDNIELYSIGASLKDAGRLTFGVTRMGAAAIPGLLENLRKATSSRVVYGK